MARRLLRALFATIRVANFSPINDLRYRCAQSFFDSEGGTQMMLRRFELQPMQRWHNQMDRMFWGFGQAGHRGDARAQSTPHVNVWEANDTVFVEAELPGVKAEDLDISVVENE